MADSSSFFQRYGNSLISGGAGIISGLFGALGQNIAINKQIKAQQEENEKIGRIILILLSFKINGT